MVRQTKTFFEDEMRGIKIPIAQALASWKSSTQLAYVHYKKLRDPISKALASWKSSTQLANVP